MGKMKKEATTRVPFNWVRLKNMWDAGKSYSEISKALDAHYDPEGDDPTKSVRAKVSVAMNRGVTIDGKLVHFKRRSKVAAEKTTEPKVVKAKKVAAKKAPEKTKVATAKPTVKKAAKKTPAKKVEGKTTTTPKAKEPAKKVEASPTAIPDETKASPVEP